MRISIFLSLILFSFSSSYADVIQVSTQQQFNDALNTVAAGDTIMWENGTYSDIFMDIEIDDVIVMAEEPGEAKFNGASRIEITGDYVEIHGLQFIDGDIGTKDVIHTWGSYNVFSDINISGYTSYKYLVIREQCERNVVRYCNFENRLNLDDKNILSILVDDNVPGYHKIQYCSFKNFDGTGGDLGIEPIRIGLSTQGEFISRTTVEYCYFTQCNGDGEIISHKAKQNVYRYNTFDDNPLSELVLRHGDEGIVYGNFFINSRGGIRIREGQKHVIFNNYFYNLDGRAIWLMNDDADPLDEINILFNTFINNQEIRLGGSGGDPPTNVTFSNNIFTDPQDDLFDDPTGTETWINNIAFGSLGMSLPDGITDADPLLEENSEGYYGPSSNSPVLNAAVGGYPALPDYPELNIDSEVLLDLMQQERPSDVNAKDLGCTENPQNVLIRPIATANNTGPSYFRDEQFKQVTLSTNGGGQIMLNPPGGVYESGTQLTFTAVPDADYAFSNWAGDLSGSENPVTITIIDNMNVAALFDLATGLIPDADNQLRVYPNPVNDELSLEILQGRYGFEEIRVYNSEGSILQSIQNEGIPVKSINVKGYKPGIYYLILTRPKTHNQVIRFIKE